MPSKPKTTQSQQTTTVFCGSAATSSATPQAAVTTTTPTNISWVSVAVAYRPMACKRYSPTNRVSAPITYPLYNLYPIYEEISIRKN